MPIEKPKKPTELIPRAFGGIKNNFSDDLQSTGFEPNIPQTYNGDNLNYHLDATGKELDYVEKVVDFINQAPVNHVPFVNENNQLDYVNKDELGGGGLEIGDVGIAPLGIDETKGKRRYLNGQIIIQDQYAIFSEKVKSAIAQYPTLGCTEQEWQTIATKSVGGQCGKFVIDEEEGTIRLPKIIMPIQGLTDLSKLAEIVKAGLPDHTHTLLGGKSYSGTANNALGNGTNNAKASLQAIQYASENNSIYGKSDTVQQEQIQYPYFIQVATGAETEDNIVNTLELNNPFVLLEPKFFESEVYNVSWLLANGTYNGSSAVHPSAYQALLVENNAEVAIGSIVTLPIGTEYTKRGLSVKLSTDSDITDYDFVVNTSDETFRLPTKVNLASGKAVVGNGMTLGLTDGINNGGLYDPSGNDFQLYTGAYGTQAGSTTSTMGTTNVGSIGVTTDPTKSGIETSDSNLYLYFYVGETVQNANLINAGRIEEKLSNIIPQNSELITSYGVPDYSAGVGITANTNFTCPTNGVIAGEVSAASNGYCKIIINDINVMQVGSEANQRCRGPFYAQVKKGDVVYLLFSGNANIPLSKFFP